MCQHSTPSRTCMSGAFILQLLFSAYRELAQQIQAAARPLKKLFGLSSLCLYGGVDKQQQVGRRLHFALAQGSCAAAPFLLC